MLYRVFFCLVLTLGSTLASVIEAIENSIIPIMEKFESIENLSEQKYPQEQFAKIRCALKKKRKNIRITSYNMLFNLFDQNLAPENRWPERLPRIVELINDMDPDIIAPQELQPDQVQDLLPFLENKYRFFSINSSEGEQNGVFFKKKRFCVLKKAIFLMQPTTATLTMVQLKDRKTSKSLAICNAHFAFSNIENRNSQAHFVAKKVALIVKEMPVLFMGDLNTFPNRPDMNFPALDGDFVNKILTKKTLRDSIDVSVIGHVGPIATFTNKDGDVQPFQGTGTPGVFLDHIYVSKGITVLIHAVQPATVDGHFPSDHMPVVIDCVL